MRVQGFAGAVGLDVATRHVRPYRTTGITPEPRGMDSLMGEDAVDPASLVHLHLRKV